MFGDERSVPATVSLGARRRTTYPPLHAEGSLAPRGRTLPPGNRVPPVRTQRLVGCVQGLGFRTPPARLTVLGMNPDELNAIPSAGMTVVHDLNAESRLPFPNESFDAVVCCVSVDYLTRPIEVFTDVARLLRQGGPFVCAFSNRCFPTKGIRGWLYADDKQHCEIVEQYFRLSGRWDEPRSQRRTPVSHPGDPLLAVWARRAIRTAPDDPRSPAEIGADR